MKRFAAVAALLLLPFAAHAAETAAPATPAPPAVTAAPAPVTTPPAATAAPTPADTEKGPGQRWAACATELQKLCANTERARGAKRACLESHASELSAGCKDRLAEKRPTTN